MTMDDQNKDNTAPVKSLPVLCHSVVERYFVRGYKVNLPKGGILSDFCEAKSNMNDVRILRHSNRICIVTMAPTHPALRPGTTITSVSFKVTDKLDRSNNVVSGKRKRGAQWLNPSSPLCIVTCDDGAQHTVFCGIRAKLVEMNERLLSKPKLLQSKTETEGYVAIVMPKLEEANHTMDGLLTAEDYLQYRLKQETLHSVSSDKSPPTSDSNNKI
uniref:Protein Simiate n=1 Tax=Phallusia mammillata TaxID=59560 RepID=A0A6F9D5T1_9ASCI|nr:protein Simiate-like [Phallusia mammillata]